MKCLFCKAVLGRVEEGYIDWLRNAIPGAQIEMMFSLLTDTTVQIERLRAFGIPTLDDAAAVMLSGWLQGAPLILIPNGCGSLCSLRFTIHRTSQDQCGSC